MSDRALPKSLHTVTVLVELAHYHRASALTYSTPDYAVDWALRVLRLADLPDVHGLREAAVARVVAAWSKPAGTLGNGPRLDRASEQAPTRGL